MRSSTKRGTNVNLLGGKNNMNMSYYEILGINEDATQEEVKKSYKSLVMKYHPDVNNAQNAAQFFRLITEAYQELKDPEKREKYDSVLMHQSQDGATYSAPPPPTPTPPPESTNYKEAKSDTFFSEEISQEKFERRCGRSQGRPLWAKILLFPLKLILKLVCIILIILLGFIEMLLRIVTAGAVIVSGIIIFLGVVFLIIMLCNFSSFFGDGWWVSVLTLLGIFFVGYILPYVAIYLAIPFTFLKSILKNYVFPDSEYDDLDIDIDM